MKKHTAIIISFFFILCTSCKWGENKEPDVDMSRNPVVSVYDYILYKGDIEKIVPAYLSEEDSLHMSEEYIRSWVDEKLMYDKAQQNITDIEAIDQLVEEYRKTLVLSTYQERILKDHFSKSAREDSLRLFYETNRDLFLLERAIIKGLYLKIPINSPQLRDFRKWYVQKTDAAIENIEKNIVQNGVEYQYFNTIWAPFASVAKNIPYNFGDENTFLSSRSNIEVKDTSFVYLLSIRDYLLPGKEAPYEYIKPKAPKIYMEKNRMPYLNKIKQDLYDKAEVNKKIKYYK